MTAPDPYSPPTSATILSRQDEVESLRLLLAQRRLYSGAKKWSHLRFIGFTIIAIAAPVLTALEPTWAVALGATAGLWIFLSRTLFVAREQKRAARGAEVQEQFDLRVFEMPALAERSPRSSFEDVSVLTGDDTAVGQAARSEKLEGWYPIDPAVDGASAIAIAQRANAAYSERLLSLHAKVWLGITIVWALLILILGMALDLTVGQFVLGIALPLLPALLDVVDQWRIIRSACAERRAIAEGIEQAIRVQTSAQRIAGDQLLVWQDQLYGLRRASPQVPDFLYSRTRKKNERAMNAAATELGRIAKDAP